MHGASVSRSRKTEAHGIISFLNLWPYPNPWERGREWKGEGVEEGSWTLTVCIASDAAPWTRRCSCLRGHERLSGEERRTHLLAGAFRRRSKNLSVGKERRKRKETGGSGLWNRQVFDFVKTWVSCRCAVCKWNPSVHLSSLYLWYSKIWFSK